MTNNTFEPILNDDNTRYSIFPIKYPDIWKEYQRQKNSFWVAEEIEYSADIGDWENLNDDERYFIENILAFFSEADGIVSENISINFIEEVKIPEARMAYRYQAMMEDIHSTVYGLLIDTFVKDPKRKHFLFEGIKNIPTIKEKADWAFKWMNKDRSFASRLVAFAILEGVFFSGSFCAIFWLKSRGKMLKALAFSNEQISKDEGMHTDFGILLYSKLENKLTEEEIHSIVKEAVIIEIKFITESLPCNLIGMNKDNMSEYIKFVADRLVTQLGYKKIYNSINPFDFMEFISLDRKSNFFETKVSEYRLGVISNVGELKIIDDY